MRRVVSVVAMMAVVAAMMAVMVTPAFGAAPSPKANSVGRVATEFNTIQTGGGGAIISTSGQLMLIGEFASNDKRRGPK